MSLLAFIGDSDKNNQEKIINLLKAVGNLDEFRNIDSSDLFSDPQRIYIIIDDLVINIPREENKTWSDIDVREIKEYLKSVPFWIGDEVIKVGDENNTFKIVDVSLNLNNSIIYKLNINGSNSWTLAEELSLATTLEIVGYKCNHCGKILRSKKPHMCNGNYRCKKLSFSPIQEDLGYIEVPEGYRISKVEGNKIRLEKINEK